MKKYKIIKKAMGNVCNINKKNIPIKLAPLH